MCSIGSIDSNPRVAQNLDLHNALSFPLYAGDPVSSFDSSFDRLSAFRSASQAFESFKESQREREMLCKLTHSFGLLVSSFCVRDMIS